MRFRLLFLLFAQVLLPGFQIRDFGFIFERLAVLLLEFVQCILHSSKLLLKTRDSFGVSLSNIPVSGCHRCGTGFHLHVTA